MTEPVMLIGSIVAVFLALSGWMAKHITNSRKHPNQEDLVFGDVCKERGKANDQSHLHLKEGIEKAIIHSNEQHIELKKDMKDGFNRVENLIRNGNRG